MSPSMISPKVADVRQRADEAFGQSKAVGEILQIVGRRHHHRFGAAIDDQRDRGFFRHVALTA
jgi:hypothetical protein